MRSEVNETEPLRRSSLRTLTFGLLGAAALAAGMMLVRQQTREGDVSFPQPGQSSSDISLDRLRELGI
jgi:hypothetical protein